MKIPKEQVSAFMYSIWDDRVARDLGKPFHEVVFEDFEEWQRKGFSVAPGELTNLYRKNVIELVNYLLVLALRNSMTILTRN